jgi:hypothetical protein
MNGMREGIDDGDEQAADSRQKAENRCSEDAKD